MNSVTIPVSSTKIPDKTMDMLEVKPSIESLLRRKIEAFELEDPNLVCCKDVHPFAKAAHDAFYDHYPLTFTPDAVWFCIAQGFAHHVNLNAEVLRKQFVSYDGKKKLLVNRPDFVLGQPNPWREVFSEFSLQIGENVGETLREIVVADFSTSNHIHKAATEILLMDAFQAYFDYEMVAGCGIPSITLKGAPDDWRNIRVRAASLSRYGLETWIRALLPILDQIEATSRGRGDSEFWKSFFRHRSMSGGGTLTGWINVLFPYLKSNEKLIPNKNISDWQYQCQIAIDNEKITDWRQQKGFQGPDIGSFPSGLSSAPVKCLDQRTGESHKLRFIAGLFGVSQDITTKNLMPTFGWAVTYDTILPVIPKPGHLSEWDQQRNDRSGKR